MSGCGGSTAILRLGKTAMARLEEQEATGFAVSIISCWEVTKLVENRR
jgi:PIN domain nuclease of toxin-antitoxin system